VHKSKSRRKNPCARAARCRCRSYILGGIDWPGNSPGNEPTAEDWSRRCVRCIGQARHCDVLLFVNREDEQACGSLIEAGLVVCPDMTFSYHSLNCRNFSALADAIAAIVAMQAGEAARGYLASISGTISS
jgi:hypothetical protein